MSSSANIVVVMGNLTRNPELRYTPGGRPVTTLNLAVNRRYKDRDSGEWVENTDFIPVTVWGNQAENCEKYLSKGRGVYVEGRLNQSRWENQEGESRSRLDVVARNVQFLPGGGSGSSSNTRQGSEDKEAEKLERFEEEISEEEDNEEIPF